MMTTLYFILFVISFFYLCLLLFRFRHNISVYYVLLAVCIILINYGYWQISIANTLEEALAASRVSYLGSAFVGYFMVCCIAQLTKTKIPFVLQCIWITLAEVVVFLAMTIGRSPIYYKSAQLMQVNGFSYLIKEYGPTHVVFVAEILLMMCYGLLMVAISFTPREKVSYISSICSLAVMACVSIVYFEREMFIPFCLWHTMWALLSSWFCSIESACIIPSVCRKNP